MDTLNLICLGNVLGITLIICMVYYISVLTLQVPKFMRRYYSRSYGNSLTVRETQVYPRPEGKVPPNGSSGSGSDVNLYTNGGENDDDTDVENSGSLLHPSKIKVRKVLSKRGMSNGEEYEYEALISETEIQNNKTWMKFSQDVLLVGRIVVILTTIIPIIVITAEL